MRAGRPASLPACASSERLHSAISLWLGSERPSSAARCTPVRVTKGRCTLVVRAAEADEGQQEPPSEPSQQTQPQPQSRQQPPPPHKIYRGVAGSPTSYPIVPPYRPGMEEEDEDDYEWIDVGKQFQVPNPDRGPLEQQISTSFVQGMMADKVNLDETNYWFTEPPEGWNQGEQFVRAAKREPNNLRRNARHAGPMRAELHDVPMERPLYGVITALWLYEGIQVDIGAQWDGLVAIHHDKWETIKHDLYLGQEVEVQVFRIITAPRCKFPLQMVLIQPEAMIPHMMNPVDYEIPFDLDGLNTVEEREAATGLSWQPDTLLEERVGVEEETEAREHMTPEYAAQMKADSEEWRQVAAEKQKAAKGRNQALLHTVGVDFEKTDKRWLYTWGAIGD